VLCWGANVYGELGSSPAERWSEVPRAVAGVQDAIAVTAHDDRTCVLCRDGAVRCWGGPTDEDGPRVVELPRDGVQLSFGEAVCVRRRGGSVACRGPDDFGQLGDGPRREGRNGDEANERGATVVGLGDARDLAVANQHGCALRAGGSVVCWGCAARCATDEGVPLVETPDQPVVVPGLSGVVALARGIEPHLRPARDRRGALLGRQRGAPARAPSTRQRPSPRARLVTPVRSPRRSPHPSRWPRAPFAD
jgi:hypothetical protein